MADFKQKYTCNNAIIKVSQELWKNIEPLLLSYGCTQQQIIDSNIKDELEDFILEYETNKDSSFGDAWNDSLVKEDLQLLNLTSTKTSFIKENIRTITKQYFNEKVDYQIIDPVEDQKEWAKYLSYTDIESINQHKLIDTGQTAQEIIPTVESSKELQDKTTQELIEQYGPAYNTTGQETIVQTQKQQNINNNFGKAGGISVLPNKTLISNNPASTYVSILLPIFSDVKRNAPFDDKLVSSADNQVIWMPDSTLQLGNVGTGGPKYFKSLDIQRIDLTKSNIETMTIKDSVSFQNTLPRTYTDQNTVIFNGTLVLSTYFDKSLELTLLESYQALQTGLAIDMQQQPENKKQLIEKYAMKIEYGYQDPSYANKRCKNLYALITNIGFNTDLETVTITFTSINAYFSNGVMPKTLLDNINAYITTFVGTNIGTGGRYSHIVEIIAQHYGWNTDKIMTTSVVTYIERPKESQTALEYIKENLLKGAIGDNNTGTDFTVGFIEDPSKELGLSFIYQPTQNVEKNQIQVMKNFNFVINGTNNGTVRNWVPQINNGLGSFKFFWEDALNYTKAMEYTKQELAKNTDINTIQENVKEHYQGKFRDTKDYKTRFYYGIASQTKELFKSNVGISAESQEGLNVAAITQILGGNQIPNILTNSDTPNDVKEAWLKSWTSNFNEYTYTLNDGMNITGDITVSGDTELKMFDYINIQPMYPATMTDPPAMHPTAGTYLILGITDHIDSDFTTTLNVWKSYIRMQHDGSLYNQYGDMVEGHTGTQQETMGMGIVAYGGGNTSSETSTAKYKAGDKIILRQLWLNKESSTEGVSHLYTNEGIVKLKEEIEKETQNEKALQEKVDYLNARGEIELKQLESSKNNKNKAINEITKKINENGLSSTFGYQFQLKRED